MPAEFQLVLTLNRNWVVFKNTGPTPSESKHPYRVINASADSWELELIDSAASLGERAHLIRKDGLNSS